MVRRRKLVVIGDEACGKTSLLQAFRQGRPQLEYQPTVIGAFEGRVAVDGMQVDLALWDTTGSRGLDELRRMSYVGADAIIACYSVDQPESIDNIIKKWLPEVQLYCPRAPVIVVANKRDVLCDPIAIAKNSSISDRVTASDMGTAVAAAAGAFAFLECSAKSMEGVQAVFEAATRAVLLRNIYHRRRRGRCLVS